MKAAQLTAYGDIDVVQVTDAALKPTPAADQILVEVYAAGVNPFDNTVRRGDARSMAELDLPATLGGDFAGIVTEVGAEASGFEVGQAVYGQAGALSGQGSFAEFTPVKASQAAAKPQSLDFVGAAALPLVGASAYQALVETLDLQTGQKILIHGGGGGIGSTAIQLAKYLGAHIATTARGAEAEFVRSLGADEVIDYETQDFSQLIKDYDAVYDTVGGETNRKSYAVLRPGGGLLSMVAQPDQELIRRHDINYTHQFTMVTTDKLIKIAQLVDEGVLKVSVDKVFALDQAAEALQYLQTGHPRGKVVIRVKAS